MFLYACLFLLIKPGVVFADNLYIPNHCAISYISKQKSETNLYKEHETYYAIVQNNKTSKITNTNNRNNNLGFSIIGENPLRNDLSKYFITNKNIICRNHVFYDISPNLKNTIYTRAP